MPRAGWKKPESDRRLSDLVSVGVLTRVFPPDLVDEVIAEVGRTEQRHRSLPARVMAYFSGVRLALSVAPRRRPRPPGGEQSRIVGPMLERKV